MSSQQSFGQQPNQAKDPGKADGKGQVGAKLFGEFTLVTNYVRYGITESQKDPALQGAFGYQWAQAKVGIWGSNVSYQGTDESLNLRPFVLFKVEFTTNVDLTLQYAFNRFYKPSDKNGTLIDLDFNLFGYHVMIERNDNWYGTQTISQHYGFKKDWSLPWTLLGSLYGGYNMITAAGFKNYFDLRPAVSYKWVDLTYELAMTYNSASSQYDGDGDMFWMLSINAKF